MRQYNRDRPYEPEHRGSLARKAQPPKNLLAEFVEQYDKEVSIKLHSSDVWRDRVNEDEAKNGIQAVGGSLLGSPRTNEDFRRFIEGSPKQTEIAEYDGHKDLNANYSYPLQAALAELRGRASMNEPFGFIAEFLRRTFQRGGDWDGAGASMGIPEPLRGFVLEMCLRRLWSKYETEPPARTLRTDAA